MEGKELKVLRRWGTVPRERPGCGEASNCPDVFELVNGDFVINSPESSELFDSANNGSFQRWAAPGDTAVRVPRDVMMAVAAQYRQAKETGEEPSLGGGGARHDWVETVQDGIPGVKCSNCEMFIQEENSELQARQAGEEHSP